MTTTEREHLAWHIAGHAWAATESGFPIHRVALDGFSEADRAHRGDAGQLDQFTMIRPPADFGPAGTYEHIHAMQRLMVIALAGPLFELNHRQLPGAIPNLQQFEDDWLQAWTAAGVQFPNERERMDFIAWRVGHISSDIVKPQPTSFCERLVPQLLDRGTLAAAEVQATFDEVRRKPRAKRSRVQA